MEMCQWLADQNMRRIADWDNMEILDCYRYLSTDAWVLFVHNIYDTIRALFHMKMLSDYVGSRDNLLEEILLKEAYARKDYEFAEKLIENYFYGAMQKALFDIVYDHDQEKARSVALRLNASYIALLLNLSSRYFSSRQKANILSIDPMASFIFECIDFSTAENVGRYIAQYQKRNPACAEAYRLLLQKKTNSTQSEV